jgi:hypothetical protein
MSHQAHRRRSPVDGFRHLFGAWWPHDDRNFPGYTLRASDKTIKTRTGDIENDRADVEAEDVTLTGRGANMMTGRRSKWRVCSPVDGTGFSLACGDRVAATNITRALMLHQPVDGSRQSSRHAAGTLWCTAHAAGLFPESCGETTT